MSTVNLSGYADPEFLRQFAPRMLVWLLAAERDYLASQGVVLPALVEPAESPGAVTLDYDGLARVFQQANDLPKSLMDRLFLVKQMSSPHLVERILEAVEERQLSLPVNPNECSPADLATQIYQLDPQLFREIHAHLAVKRYRVFAYLMPRGRRRALALTASVAGLERTLNSWYAAQGMDRSARVCQRQCGAELAFYVRHGRKVRREGAVCLKTCESESQIYRPEGYGLVVYHAGTGELRVHADSKKEQNLFRTAFGLHLFGDANYFQWNSYKFNLNILKTGRESLTWAGLPGIREVRLTELGLAYGPDDDARHHFAASDVYAEWTRMHCQIPPEAQIRVATFTVQLDGWDDPVSCTLRPTNCATFPEGTEVWLMPWLVRQKMAQEPTDHPGDTEDLALELLTAGQP